MIKKICIIRDDRLGDLILTLPIIEALKLENNVHITLVCSNLNKNLADKSKLFNEINVVEKKLVNQIKLIKKIRKEKFDLVINCSPFKNKIYKVFISGKYKVTSLFLSRYKKTSRIKKIFLKKILSAFYDDIRLIDRYQNKLNNNILHQTDIVLGLFDKTNLKFTNVKSYNFPQNFVPSKNLIIIHLSNQWLMDKRIINLNELIKLIRQNTNYTLILTTEKKLHPHFDGALKEIPILDTNKTLEINKTYVCFEPSFDYWIKILNTASYIITPECGCAHVATMLGKKTIIIYDENNFPDLINKEYEPYKNYYEKFIFGTDNIVKSIMKILR